MSIRESVGVTNRSGNLHPAWDLLLNDSYLHHNIFTSKICKSKKVFLHVEVKQYRSINRSEKLISLNKNNLI